MKIIRGRAADGVSVRRSETFTGTVWLDPVLPTTDGTTVNNVFFAPGARTHWHSHEHGQILHVTAGGGLVRTRGEAPQRLQAGDTVWVPPGEVHWHGGAPGSYLLHLAVSLGTTSWLEPVGDDEYSAAGDAP
ncbi:MULTISPECIES: cupin domain-containing protein [Actinomadura]|uniref:Cupin domain protein n=1 Tax=Actinomadura madurae TaxID=1993 RepID=A0A1I5P8Y2_9ACTN|nr:cupin domain-containing protein [Actinomadura madurae]SFP30397.1 Cupin domain protein [Actinomadura madurae]SPT63837.1 Cupin domain [Actinomadura madurae]